MAAGVETNVAGALRAASDARDSRCGAEQMEQVSGGWGLLANRLVGWWWLVALCMWCSCSKDGESIASKHSLEPSGTVVGSAQTDRRLLPRWAGSALWDDEDSKLWPEPLLRVVVAREDTIQEPEPGTCLSASLSGRRLAFSTGREVPPYELSEDEKARNDKLRRLGVEGGGERDIYEELVVLDVDTGHRAVIAIFTRHPELHRADPGGPAVIKSDGLVALTWWSGETVVYALTDNMYRFDLRDSTHSRVNLAEVPTHSIEDARSSPLGKPLSLRVQKGDTFQSCLVDAMTGKVVWSCSDAESPLCWSPSGRFLAWLERANDGATSATPVVAIRDTTTGEVARYAPRSALLGRSLFSPWWVRTEDRVVFLTGYRRPEPESTHPKPFDVGVWKVGSDRVERVGLRTDGPDMFTPL